MPLPRRSTGEAYRGSNILTLWAAAAARGLVSPYWMTYKQATAQGANVRRGETGTQIVFYAPRANGDAVNSTDEQDAENRPRRGAVLKGFIVFNADQIEGLADRSFHHSEDTLTTGDEQSAALSATFAKIPATVVQSNAAFYRPSTDSVHMPAMAQFISAQHYFATLAHELAHWTRHPNRLDRDFKSQRYGDSGYALEELVAELTSAFLGAELGLPVNHFEEHASYIQSWLQVLTHDPSAFLTAAGKAQAAADYLRRFWTQ